MPVRLWYHSDRNGEYHGYTQCAQRRREGGGGEGGRCARLRDMQGTVASWRCPGMPATPAAIKEVEFWVDLEEQEEVAKALAADTEAVLIEKMNDKFTEDSDSDEKKELNNTGEVKSAEGGRLMAPPPYSDLSGFFGPLEQFAQAAENTEAGHFLREAKMSFLSAHAAKPAR